MSVIVSPVARQQLTFSSFYCKRWKGEEDGAAARPMVNLRTEKEIAGRFFAAHRALPSPQN